MILDNGKSIEAERKGQAVDQGCLELKVGQLVVVIDWLQKRAGSSRAVLSWKLSNTVDTSFCLAVFREVRQKGAEWAMFSSTVFDGRRSTEVSTSGLMKPSITLSGMEPTALVGEPDLTLLQTYRCCL